ncbi:MAG: methyltransferase family protein [Chitinispirillaceae bacterium]
MRRFIITLIYIAFFWILLPFALLYPSLILDRRLGLKLGRSTVNTILGVILSSVSAVMLALSILDFRKGAQKLPITALPPYDKIVTQGVYSYWRHPVYLFYTLLFAGVGLMLRSGGLLFVVLPLFSILESVHAYIEELYLVNKHGEAYRRYKRETGVVIPRFKKRVSFP